MINVYVPDGMSPRISGALARIERSMPRPGDILVRVGQRVEPDDVIGRCYAPGVPHIIGVARALLISPSDVTRALRRELGNQVQAGDELARAGRFGRQLLAPVSGRISAVDVETGYVTITPERGELQLQATVRGVVMGITANRIVAIETAAAQVHGAFGLGESRSGVLRLLATDRSEPITAEMVDVRSAYAVIIGGSGIDAAALRRAVAEQVRGVIVGGIDERELRDFLGVADRFCWHTGAGFQIPAAQLGRALPLTLVVTEGFGVRPMAAPLFDLLAEHDRQEALIEGATSLRAPHARPKVVIPISSRTPGVQLTPPRPAIAPGVQVRITDPSYLGQTGRVRAVSSMPDLLPSGVLAPLAEVTLDGGRSARIPLTAVEALS